MKRGIAYFILLAVLGLSGCRALPTGAPPAAIEPPVSVVPAPYDEVTP